MGPWAPGRSGSGSTRPPREHRAAPARQYRPPQVQRPPTRAWASLCGAWARVASSETRTETRAPAARQARAGPLADTAQVGAGQPAGAGPAGTAASGEDRLERAARSTGLATARTDRRPVAQMNRETEATTGKPRALASAATSPSRAVLEPIAMERAPGRPCRSGRRIAPVPDPLGRSSDSASWGPQTARRRSLG